MLLAEMTEKRKLQIFWLTRHRHDADWESDYIKDLLSDLPQRNIEPEYATVRSMEQISPNALLVMNHDLNYPPYIEQYNQRRLPFGAIHLSDEWFNDHYGFYTSPMCKFVMRNYYHEDFEKFPKVSYFALSYKRGFWEDYHGENPKNIPFTARKYIWSFAGAPRTAERQATLDVFKALDPNYLHYEMGNSFSSPETGLTTAAYRDLLLSSQFGLCPIGISKTVAGETGRVTECLEAGCIPIVLAGRNSRGETYWQSLYGTPNPPFVIGSDWQDCLRQVQELLKDPAACESRRLEYYDFWQRYKKGLREKFCDLCEDLLGDV